MGHVFRARDSRLNRDVAIKVLPEAFANEPDRLARFQREAKTLASLNHPNIGAIYGLEESGGVSALVMELVEGEDLSQRITLGAIPVDQALPIAKQIADALEAAHDQGIIHRDLKPANIKIRADGTVKVLDFGLAKAMEPSGGMSASVSTSPTLTTPAMTQAGMILGTAAYMSPEQARGTTVDKRADIWAFGVVLWEMLTGKRLFEGATVSDTLASVLKTEPDWTALAPTTDPAIRRLLRRCLEKDRRRRLSDAADARLEIDEALTTPSADAAAASSSAVSRRRVTAVAGVALLVGAVGAAVTLGAFVWRAPAPQVWNGVMLGGPQVSVSPRPSPDGHLLAFVGNDVDDVLQLWVAKPGSGNRIMLTHNRERGYVQSCAWSADGNRIFYDRWFDGPKGVFSVAPLGGDEQLVLEDAMFPEPLPDGSLLLVRINPEHRQQLFRYWPDSGKLQGYAVEPTSGLSGPRSVRDGRLALVIGLATAPGADRGLHAWVVDLLSGELRPLAVDLSNASNFSIAATWDGKRALIGATFGSLYRVISIPLDASPAGSQRATTLLTLTLSAWTIDAGPDDSIYVEQNDRPLELVRFAVGSSASVEGSGRVGAVRVERIATLASSGLSTMRGDYFAVLPDGRAVWTEVSGGRNRVMVVEAGKDAVPLVSTSEETWGPMTAVGVGGVAFMLGSKGRPAIGLAALANGRITRQFPFDKGFVSGMAASPDGNTIYAVAEGLVWAVPVTGEAPRKVRSGDGVTVDIATQSLVVFVQQPGNSRLIRIPLTGGPEQDIAGSFRIAAGLDPGSLHNGRLVSPLAAPYWYWPPGIFDLATGTSQRIPLDYAQDFHHMAWTPDGKVMAVAVGFRGSIWKFTPEGK